MIFRILHFLSLNLFQVEKKDRKKSSNIWSENEKDPKLIPLNSYVYTFYYDVHFPIENNNTTIAGVLIMIVILKTFRQLPINRKFQRYQNESQKEGKTHKTFPYRCRTFNVSLALTH